MSLTEEQYHPINPASYTIESEDFTLTNPTKEGYVFEGWTGTDVDAELSTDVTIYSGSTGNREYTAHWTANTYVISYNLNGGTLTDDNPTSYTPDSDDITLNNPERKGYYFDGWTGTDLTEAEEEVTRSNNSGWQFGQS